MRTLHEIAPEKSKYSVFNMAFNAEDVTSAFNRFNIEFQQAYLYTENFDITSNTSFTNTFTTIEFNVPFTTTIHNIILP